MTSPTPQQQTIIDTVLAGPPAAVIVAGAGTGKTKVIRWIASVFADYGVGGAYVALNKSVAAEVGSKFDRGNVAAMTIHSLCFQIATTYPHISVLLSRLGSDNAVPRWKLARHMKYAQTYAYSSFTDRNHARYAASAPARNTTISANRMLIHGLDALRSWCASDAETVGPQHVDCPVGMPPEVFDNDFAGTVVELANWLWAADITHPEGRIAFTHDYYLKMVSLQHPDLTAFWPHGSLLLVDEAQDARPAMLSIIRDQIGKMRIVAVGDSAQAINGFTGAIDALPILSQIPGAAVLPLSQSFRFGAEIAEASNRILDVMGAQLRLTGSPSITSSVHVTVPSSRPPEVDAVLVRTNARLIQEVSAEQAAGRRVHAVADIDYISWIMQDISRICSGQSAHHKSLKHLTGEHSLREFCDPKSGEAGDLGMLLRMGLNTGPEHVLSILEKCTDAEHADTVVCTIHKSKGREWDRVRLALSPEEIIPGTTPRIPSRRSDGTFEQRSMDELMALYVAMTRAAIELYLPADLSEAIDLLVAPAHAGFAASGPVAG
ncbi:AAA family ATPase [Corynebacterium sp. AOP12-C2-36]|uniref:AAA family ATPase n=1 Tax=Corynebacterium sp. AOP12-C2-36 TaxID=3457723 RepID=UPI004033197B